MKIMKIDEFLEILHFVIRYDSFVRARKCPSHHVFIDKPVSKPVSKPAVIMHFLEKTRKFMKFHEKHEN